LTEIFTISPFPGREACDFCSERPTTQIYPCKNFVVPRFKTSVFQHESIGGWAACSKCAELIDAGRWAELTDRAFTNFLKQHCIPRYAHFDVREQFREIHQLFRENLVKES
jgi:hypothetical protein